MLASRCRLQCALLLIFACLSPLTYAVTDIVITADTISHPQFNAQKFFLKLNVQTPQPQLIFQSELQPIKDNIWTVASLDCQLPKSLQTGAWHCEHGLIKNKWVNIPFDLDISHLFLDQQFNLAANLHLKQANFSDESGLHAAEKLNGQIVLSLKPLQNNKQTAWAWQTQVDWQSGELFWQPFYVGNGGHQIIANGQWVGQNLVVDEATLKIHQVGNLRLDGNLDLATMQIINLNADLPSLQLATAYPLLFKPFLEKTAFNHADIAGDVALKLTIKDKQLRAFNLQLHDVDIDDQNHKFSFYKMNADIPWDYDEPQQVNLRYQSGALLGIPLDKTNISAEVNRYAVTAPNIRLPILDGALNLSDVSAARLGDDWYWHLSASVEPISMANVSKSLKLPLMQGKASAQIPLVTYNNGMLTTDGSVVLNVFNGTATITDLVLQQPLSNTPKLNANMTLRSLDLGELTRTYSFGAIEGKLDGDISQLEMQNWKPIKFDATVQSSQGKYPKKISQRAVENISALGGAGAAAAVQRSVLRFFEQFNYEKMGISCQLRNDICEMHGIESTPQGYIIVKGSGIPAITVLGYNKTVGWADLLARIKRVTDGNSKAVIQ